MLRRRPKSNGYREPLLTTRLYSSLFLSSSNVKGDWHLLREFSEYLRELSNYLRDILEKLGVFLSILSAKYLPSTLHLKINH